MEGIRKEALIWASLLLGFWIWVALLWATNTPLTISWEAIKKFPDVVTIYVFASWVFTKWLWRLQMFQGWLVRVPNLQGTWSGELQSTWGRQGEQDLPPIRMILVIGQTFSSINCTMFTAESESDSRAARIERDSETKAVTISYNYTNRTLPEVRERSPMHDGAAHLKCVKVPHEALEGEYWTRSLHNRQDNSPFFVG